VPPPLAAFRPSSHPFPLAVNSCVRTARRVLQSTRRRARIGSGGSTRTTLGTITTLGSDGRPPGLLSLFHLPLPRSGSVIRAILDSTSDVDARAGSAPDVAPRLTSGPGPSVIAGFHWFAIGFALELARLAPVALGAAACADRRAVAFHSSVLLRHSRGSGYACWWLVSCDYGLARDLTIEIMNSAFLRLWTGSGPHGTDHGLALIRPAQKKKKGGSSAFGSYGRAPGSPCPPCGLAIGSTGRLALPHLDTQPAWPSDLPYASRVALCLNRASL
jgi:hypothetical protein